MTSIIPSKEIPVDCDILISEFELKYRYNVHFQTYTFGKLLVLVK